MAYRQAGRTTSPSEVRTHILVFIDVDIIHSFLCTHSSVGPPTPCNPLQIVGVLSPSEAAGWATLLPSRDVSLPPDL